MAMMPPSSTTSSVIPFGAQRNVMAWLQIDMGDAGAVLEELCRRRDEVDPNYFHDFELDAHRRLKHLFWADVESRLECIEHGDVVVLDTTYRTNQYGVPFIPFLGLSLHRTPVVLGCGVITSNQSVDSFVWLLRAFMMSSTEDRPKSVITDGSDAVAAAVKIVFPESNHRMCTWHVDQGIEEHLHSSSRSEFRSLMYDVCSPVAFYQRWHSFVAKHQTATNQGWLDTMYAKRELWAATFVHDNFFLGMANDQRTECLVTGLHTGLHEGMSLLDLLGHFDAYVDSMRCDMEELDHTAARSRVVLTTRHRDLEERAARWFTPANFYRLREEIEMIDSLEVVETLMRGHPIFGKKVYKVDFKQRPGVHFSVSYSRNDVKCSCRKMEREGLPCRHILRVMRHTNMSQIPACCSLSRMQRRGEIKADNLHQLKDLGRKVFDLASEDALEFQEIKEFLEGWLEQRRGSGGVASQDHNDATGSTPMRKKIKLSDD